MLGHLSINLPIPSASWSASPRQLSERTAERLGLTWWWLSVADNTNTCNNNTNGVPWPNNLWMLEPIAEPNGDSRALMQWGQPRGTGIGCALGGALLIALGSSHMRLAATMERRRPAHQQRPYLGQPRWWSGALLLGVGFAGLFIASFFVTQWLVTLLGATATLWNAHLARTVNKEPLGLVTATLLLLALAGLTAFVLCGSPSREAHRSASALNARWVDVLQEPYFITLLSFTALTLVLLCGCDARLLGSRARAIERKLAHQRAESGTGAASDGVVLSGARADTALSQLARRQVRLLRLLYPVGAGLLAGCTAVAAATVAEWLQAYLWQPVSYPLSILDGWPLVVAAAVPLPAILHLYTRALCLFEAQVVLPTFYVLYVLVEVSGEGAYYGVFDWACLGVIRIAPFFVGLAVAIASVLTLHASRAEQMHRERPSRVLPLKHDAPVTPPTTAPMTVPEPARSIEKPPPEEPTLDPLDRSFAQLKHEAQMARLAEVKHQEELEYIARAFAIADADGDGKLNPREFAVFVDLTQGAKLERAPSLVEGTVLAEDERLDPKGQAEAQAVAAAPAAASTAAEAYEAPEGAQAGQVFMVDGQYYSAVPLPSEHPLTAAPPPPQLSQYPPLSDDPTGMLEEVRAQREMIEKLQQTLLELRNGQQPPPPLPPQFSDDPTGMLKEEVRAQREMIENLQQTLLVLRNGQPPPPPLPPQFSVPEGTRAGQLFDIDGQYYVAMPRSQTQPSLMRVQSEPSSDGRLPAVNGRLQAVNGRLPPLPPLQTLQTLREQCNLQQRARTAPRPPAQPQGVLSYANHTNFYADRYDEPVPPQLLWRPGTAPPGSAPQLNVPEGSEAGQVFVVDGQQYMAMPRSC
jgi:hypothetical protein